MKVPSKDKPEEFVTFKRLLLNRCQKEFEKDKAEESDFARRQKEIDEAPVSRYPFNNILISCHFYLKTHCPVYNIHSL